jgi:hypothetical protein
LIYGTGPKQKVDLKQLWKIVAAATGQKIKTRLHFITLALVPSRFIQVIGGGEKMRALNCDAGMVNDIRFWQPPSGLAAVETFFDFFNKKKGGESKIFAPLGENDLLLFLARPRL